MIDFKFLPGTKGNVASIIVNGQKQWRSVTGPAGMEVLRFRTLMIGLDSEERGMRLTRGVNCTQMAKKLTGLKTRDRAKLRERLVMMYNEALSRCVVVDEDEL